MVREVEGFVALKGVVLRNSSERYFCVPFIQHITADVSLQRQYTCSLSFLEFHLLFLNAVLIFRCRSQIFELCRVFEGFTIYLYVVISS
jgi:hypothetical protein